MALDKSCVSVYNKAEESFNALRIGYELNIDDALTGMIGMPNKEAKNYKMHKLLYDNMKKYFIYWGEATNFEADPWDMVGKWAIYFSRKSLNPLISRADTLPIRTLHGMNKRFERVKKKSDQIMDRPDQRMKNWERALMPPGLLMMKADKFGTVSKLIDATQDITDKAIQSYAGYMLKMDKVEGEFALHFKNTVASNPTILDNPMDGISGLFDSEGHAVTILNRKKDTAGRTSYTVSYDNMINVETQENVIKKLYPSQLSYEKKKGFFPAVGRALGFYKKYQTTYFGDEMYQSLVLQKYKNEFVNDLVHGQTRYFVPTVVANISNRDEQIIKHALSRRKARSDYIKEAATPKPDMPEEFATQKIEMRGIAGDTSTPADPEIQVSPDGLNEYLMVKQITPEETGKEMWRVYLLRTKKDSTSDWENVAFKYDEEGTDTKITDIFDEGYYKAQNEHTYSYRQGKGEIKYKKVTDKQGITKTQWFMKDIEKRTKIYYQPYKAYGNFQRLENQPSERLVTHRTEATSTEQFSNIHDLVQEYRTQYDDIFKDVQKFAQANDKDSVRQRRVITNEMKRKINPITNKVYTDAEIIEWIETNIHQLGGMESAIYEGKWGLSTSDSYFQKIGENYGPVIFTKEALEKMMDTALRSLKEKLDGELSDQNRLVLNHAKTGIERIRKLLVERGMGAWGKDVRQAASTIHTEHREQWTSNLHRRKDGAVHQEYLDKTFRNLHRNALVNKMVATMYQVSKYEKMMPSDITDYMVNRVKLSMGHVDTINRVPTLTGWNEVSNEEVANWMNTWFPKSLKAGREFDEDSAEKLMLVINGLFSGRFLGVGGAMGNRTQIVNPIIHYGWDVFSEMNRELYGDNKKYYEGVVKSTGVLNLLSMFNEIMVGHEQVDGFDFGLYPFSSSVMKNIIGGSMPIPGQNMVQWGKLVSKGKENFIKNGHSSVDKTLLKMLFREKSVIKRGEIGYLKELGDLLVKLDTDQKWQDEYNAAGISNELKIELLEKRDAYFDVFTTEEIDNERDIVEKRMRRLMGDVANHRFKKMVTWKLSWWWDKAHPELFTFTQGEQQMRRETALMAIFHARRLGLLGMPRKNEDILMSPIAKKIARDAVYQMMFGMSPVWLGEAFSGMGRTVMQYKSYTLFQMIHDANIIGTFRDTSMGEGDGFIRLFQALKEDSTDVEAQAFLRLMGLRGVATSFGVLASIAPIMWKIVGRSSGATKMVKSAENPAFAVAARMVLWAVLMAMGFSDEDEEDRQRKDWGNRMMFMLLPVLLGSLFRDVYDTVTNFTD